jgi:hypothetical protein
MEVTIARPTRVTRQVAHDRQQEARAVVVLASAKAAYLEEPC